MFGAKKITSEPKWYGSTSRTASSDKYIYTDKAVDLMLEEAVNAARKEADTSAHEAYVERIKLASEVKELQTQLDMLEPLKAFMVVYGDGYEEVVKAHKWSHDTDATAYFKLADDSLVATFTQVLSVVEVK